MISGTAYGVVLNDRDELARLSVQMDEKPYERPPAAPVVYIKPRTCFAPWSAPVALDADIAEISIGATVGILFGRDATRIAPERARAHIAAACLAIDVHVPHDSYYRPAIAQRCQDGFLPLGAFDRLPESPGPIVTSVDGQEVHRWSLDRLVRPIELLIGDLSDFMTLCAGDLLLIGLPGDAARAGRGQSITVSAEGLPTLSTRLEDVR